MKIGLFTDTFYPRMNGVATSVLMLKEQLEAMGHEVFVFTTTDPDAPEEERGVIRVPSIPFKTQRLGTFISPGLFRYVKGIRLDVIHTHTEYTLGIFGRIMAKRLGIPFIHTMHTLYEDYTDYVFRINRLSPAAKNFARRLTKTFCNMADEVIVPTGKVFRLVKSYGVWRNISVIPSGIELSRFAPELRDGAAILRLRKELGICDGEKVLVSIGRVAKEKNLDEMILELRDFLLQRDDVKLFVVGEGQERPRLLELCSELGLCERVFFLGARPWREISLYYGIADVFVAASSSETQGLTYIEALASGLPVVAKWDECLEGVVFDGENGFAPRDMREFSAAVCALLDDDKRREEFSRCAAARAGDFSAQVYALRAESLYLKIIRRREREWSCAG